MVWSSVLVKDGVLGVAASRLKMVLVMRGPCCCSICKASRYVSLALNKQTVRNSRYMLSCSPAL